MMGNKMAIAKKDVGIPTPERAETPQKLPKVERLETFEARINGRVEKAPTAPQIQPAPRVSCPAPKPVATF